MTGVTGPDRRNLPSRPQSSLKSRPDCSDKFVITVPPPGPGLPGRHGDKICAEAEHVQLRTPSREQSTHPGGRGLSSILLGPAVSLLGRLKYAQKFALIGLTLLIPLVLFMVLYISQTNAQIGLSEKERLGLEYIVTVRKMLEHVPQHRGMSVALLSGDAGFKEKMIAKQGEIEEDIKVLDGVDRKLGADLKTQEKWSGIKTKWQDLKGKVFGLSPRTASTRTRPLIADMIALIGHVGETSTLILDPKLDTYYLMDTIVAKLPALLENMGQARAVGSGVAAKKSASVEEKVHLLTLAGLIQSATQSMHDGMHAAFRARPDLKTSLRPFLHASDDGAKKLVETTMKRLLSAERIDMSPAEYFAQATDAIGAGFKLFDAVAPALDNLLKARIGGLRKVHVPEHRRLGPRSRSGRLSPCGVL